MIKDMVKCIREYKKVTLLTPLFITFEVLLECLIPFVMARLIDSMEAGRMEPIMTYGVILIVLALLSLTSGYLSGFYAATASAGFAKNMRKDLFYRVQSFSFSDIDYFSTSSLVTRLTTDVTNVQMAFQMIIRIAVRVPLMMLFSVIMSFRIHWKMALIFIAIIPVLGGALFGISRYVYPIFKRLFKKYDALNNSVEENVSGIRVVKSFVRDEYEIEKFKNNSGELCNDFTRVEKILALNSPIMMVCIYTAILLVSQLGARIIINTHGSELSTGNLSSLITYGVQILSSMMMLSMIVVMIAISTESANRIREVLVHEPSLKNPENPVMDVLDGRIDFENVSFKYSEKSKKNALDGINLHIESGQTIGIIGGTGSSKTTLIQLISRLYDATKGQVKVGGLDVREYDLDALRDQVAVVLQKNILFAGTIKENLRWGDPNASDEELVRVCKLAQADEFVSQFPDGYDTYIEQGGTNVSGGQKQRLCIARALLKKPKILIMDDSTSAVDTKTDALIRSAMKKEIPDTTKIIIAQRVSSVEHADCILVMENGSIAESGTHEELIAQNGIYREVYDSQQQISGKEAS